MFLNIPEPSSGEENLITFIVLREDTFHNVFMSSMVSVCQYENRKSSQILHTGPLKTRSAAHHPGIRSKSSSRANVQEPKNVAVVNQPHRHEHDVHHINPRCH